MSAVPDPITPTPTPPLHFDHTRAARSAGFNSDQLRSLTVLFERDYPHDVMLRELHVTRACNAIIRGSVTIQQVLTSAEERAA